MARHEGCAEAGREGGFRLGHADLGAGDLGGVAAEEVIHRLIRGQPRDRRQHAEGIGGQHDHVRRRGAEVLLGGVGDELDRIGAAGVFGLAAVGEIKLAGGLVHRHVLEDRAKHLGGGVDFGLTFGREVDHFGVATAFKVEDRGVRPAMLIVTDQRAARIGRKRGLAGARQAEEDRALAVGADIGRAVHRHHALRGQEVVEEAEHALLHLARILGVADQDQLFGEAHRDHRVAAAAVALGIGLEAGQVDDGVFGDEARDFFRRRAHQQRFDEQVVPRHLGDHAHVDAVFGLRAAEQVGDIELFAVFEVGEEIGLEHGEMLRAHRLVDRAPVDGGLGRGIAHDVLVLDAAAGELAGLDQQRAMLRQLAFTLGERVFDQRRGAEIGVDSGPGYEVLGSKRGGERGQGRIS